MRTFQRKMTPLIFVGIVLALTNISFAEPQMIVTQTGQVQTEKSNGVSITLVPPNNPEFRRPYDLLIDHQALEKMQDILSPLHLPEALTIEVTECGVVNSFYRREIGFRPTVTICYEYLKHILESLPTETTPEGVTAEDAAVGQFFFVTLHEVGHAIFDILAVAIFGREEDAADNFATYIMLQFDRGQARRLIGGAAWAWRAYLGDYKKNPVVPTRLAAFASDHGLPQERFYNLLCLALGANRAEFGYVESYLPATRAKRCSHEYQTMVSAFRKEIEPHIDAEIAKRVLDNNWIDDLESKPASQE
jgi:Putative metallopeptidase